MFRSIALSGFSFALALGGCATTDGDQQPRIRELPILDFVHEPRGILAATLLLEDQWEIDVIPPGRGMTTLVLQLRGDALRWSLEQRNQFGSSPPRRRGELDGDAGRQRLIAVLRSLHDSGVFALPTEIQVERKVFFAAHQLTLGIEITGESGQASFQRRLPFGAETTEYGGQASVLRQLLREFREQP